MLSVDPLDLFTTLYTGQGQTHCGHFRRFYSQFPLISPPAVPPVARIAVQLMQSLGCPCHVSVQFPLRLTVSAVTSACGKTRYPIPAHSGPGPEQSVEYSGGIDPGLCAGPWFRAFSG
ncbi:hypothetical protein E2C01_020188 [Portunus trituberculatus]|uniref:Uncharacterized protein n=1 Tax=Portunus trituberculatus TaxID=210409 RepID=A0A5B7E1M0_PORTR|nr:hypothetical protein [Portunus trituberculatus]